MLNSRKVYGLVAVMFALLLAACGTSATGAPSGPDLVIRSFEITDANWFMGFLEATAHVVVENAGSQPAPPAEVGVVATNRENKRVPFGFVYGPAMPAELAAGKTVTLTGTVGLGWHGHFDVCCRDQEYDASCCAMHDEQTVWLTAIVDYCEAADHCAVEEMDEANNEKGPVVVEKPGP